MLEEIKKTAAFIDGPRPEIFAPGGGHRARHGAGRFRRPDRDAPCAIDYKDIPGLPRLDGRGAQGTSDFRRRSGGRTRRGHAGTVPLLRRLHDGAGDLPDPRHAAAGHPLPVRVERLGRHQCLVPHGRPDGHHRPYQPDAQSADRAATWPNWDPVSRTCTTATTRR